MRRDTVSFGISSVHEHIDGMAIGQHPMVTRVLKGAYNSRPPKPHYSSTWKVAQVILWLSSQDTATLGLLDLSMKTVTLCVLTWPCRSAELANMDYESIRFTPEGAIISPLALSLPKQTKAGSAIFPSFDEDTNVCPVRSLQSYCSKTEKHRPKGKHLFLTSRSTRPYHLATSATIARWIKTTLSKASVDTSIFCAHSTRSASTSAAADAGVSIPEILEAADWSSSSTFERFYYRPQAKTN